MSGTHQVIWLSESDFIALGREQAGLAWLQLSFGPDVWSADPFAPTPLDAAREIWARSPGKVSLRRDVTRGSVATAAVYPEGGFGF